MAPALYIGLMSGTSLDGVDGVLASFSDQGYQFIASAFQPFPAALRSQLMTLQAASHNEIHLEALAANSLAQLYAACVHATLKHSGLPAEAVRAIGVHGQTIRHRPECGYTRQTNNPALLAELTGIDVIADFRSRDIAAGGQGAPLVPAFHQAAFGHPQETRVIANIGGIGNITVLRPATGGAVTGFDTGPGNLLLDSWISEHTGQPYDAGGAWAASGRLNDALLTAMLGDAFFSLPPPKSTGRDLFNRAWLSDILQAFPGLPPADVQATLTALTATSMADAIARYGDGASVVYACGGGAFNTHLLDCLERRLRELGHDAQVLTTEALGVAPGHVEALAFAWLAHRHVERRQGNLSAATGARGPRILGALYPR
jgi:anhydro-N-acetylmuramic acid kinase